MSRFDRWRDEFYSVDGLRTGLTIRQEESRDREVDAAVREGLNRLSMAHRLSALEETTGIYGRCALPTWFNDTIIAAWREQHA